MTAKTDELDRHVERSARAIDEGFSLAMAVCIEEARLTDPLDVHFRLIVPLRELRDQFLGWFQEVNGKRLDHLISMPVLPTQDEIATDPLYERPKNLS